MLKKVSYQAVEYIYRQGDDLRHIYIILQDEVKIIVDNKGEQLELISFVTGDCIGETSVIGIQSHSSSALAATDTELIVLERSALFSIFENDKELFGYLILNIARKTSRRLHKSDDMLAHYVFKH